MSRQELRLDRHDVVMCKLVMPIDVRLAGAIALALHAITEDPEYGLQGAVILTDGTNRIVARRRGAPPRGEEAGAG